MQRFSSDPAPYASQQSLLGHKSENTCKDIRVPLQKSSGILQRPAGLVSSGSVAASLGCIRLHAGPLKAFVLWIYCPGFPLSVVCWTPITWHNERELAAHEQEQTEEPEHKRRTTDPLPESHWHREKVYHAQCSTALSEVSTCCCGHCKPYSCVNMAPGQISLVHWAAE